MRLNKIVACIFVLGIGFGVSSCSTMEELFPCPEDVVVIPAPFDSIIRNNSLAINSSESMAIASASFESNILIYDLTNKKLLKSLDGYITPRNVEFAADGKSFYISDSSLGVVRQISTDDFTTLNEVDVGQGAFGFAIRGNTMFVNNQAQDTVSVVNLDTWEIEHKVDGFANPRQGIKVGSSGRYVYVTNFKGDDVRVIDTDSWQVTQVLVGIHGVRAISVSKDETKLYGASSLTDSIKVVSIRNNQILKTIPTGKEPYGATLSADGHLLVTGNKESNSVQIFDMDNYRLLKTIGGLNEPRQAIVFSHIPNMIYVLQKDLSIAEINYKSESKTIVR